THPIGLCLQLLICSGCAWESIIDKRHIVTDQDIILDSDTLADKGVALYFTILANPSSLLDLNECANLRIISDFAAIEIDEIVDFYTFTKLDIRGNVLRH